MTDIKPVGMGCAAMASDGHCAPVIWFNGYPADGVKIYDESALLQAKEEGRREGMREAAKIANKVKLSRSGILHKKAKHELAEQAFDTAWDIEQAITRAAEGK